VVTVPIPDKKKVFPTYLPRQWTPEGHFKIDIAFSFLYYQNFGAQLAILSCDLNILEDNNLKRNEVKMVYCYGP